MNGHQDYLSEQLQEWFVGQSMQSTSPFFYSRATIIKKRFLPPDKDEPAPDAEEEEEEEPQDGHDEGEAEEPDEPQQDKDDDE